MSHTCDSLSLLQTHHSDILLGPRIFWATVLFVDSDIRKDFPLVFPFEVTRSPERSSCICSWKERSGSVSSVTP